MAKMMIMRTDAELPDNTGMGIVRHFLFNCFRGFGDEDKKLWNRFWNRFVKTEAGECVQVEMTFTRNYRFHKKFMALMRYGYECWTPDRKHKTYKGRPVEKNFEVFRAEITIAAGWYEYSFDSNNHMILIAKSINFAAMDEAEFEDLYDAVINVLMVDIFKQYEDRAELDAVLAHLLRFSA